ncbi:unnamed protein product [Heligmosomoides polygyrus]|uniref:Transmembrane protein n=1 Tax=Heligmosomoides polygyrus TaxID=6339 RepID=A0A183G857_HELPZ|nr:unnamed protein product [Heligmosomoides polygyrus]
MWSREGCLSTIHECAPSQAHGVRRCLLKCWICCALLLQLEGEKQAVLAGRGATAGPLIGGAGGSVGTGPETLLAQSARPSPVFVWHVDLNGASPPPEMHIWLLRKARSQLERALCLSKDANALHTAAVLLLQYSLALVVAASTPFVIRSLNRKVKK